MNGRWRQPPDQVGWEPDALARGRLAFVLANASVTIILANASGYHLHSALK